MIPKREGLQARACDPEPGISLRRSWDLVTGVSLEVTISIVSDKVTRIQL